MTVNYFDRVLYLYPNIQRIMYWHYKHDGSEWADPYDGLVWDNTDIPKPSKETLDALDATVVAAELANRKEVRRKEERDTLARTNLAIMAGYHAAEQTNPYLTLRDYLDSLEQLAHDAK